MRRDWGVTSELVAWIPDGLTPVLEILALPGDLVVIGTVLGVLTVLDIWGNVKRGGLTGPLWSPGLAFLVGVVLGGLALVVTLEAAFGLPRPPEEWHAISASPHGFPSGHTMAATVCWGALARWYGEPTKRRLSAVLGIVVIVGLSRLGLGLHYLPDILAGFGFGVLYLGAIWYLGRGSSGRAFGIALLIAMAAVLISGAGARSLIALLGVAGATLSWVVLSTPSFRTA